MSSIADFMCRACRTRVVHEDELICPRCASRFADQVEAYVHHATRQEHQS